MSLGGQAPALPRVLVVEDETMLLQSVVTGLSRVSGIEVVGAATVGAAVQEIDAKAPAMIISDIDLPDRSGIELLGELGARGLKPHIVFVSAYVKAFRAQIPPHAGVEVIEKPVTLDQLRAMVTAHLNQPAADASPFGVADYLQLASLGHHSVLIEVTTSANTGQLVVVDGEAWTARDRTGDGLEAFRRLVSGHPRGQVRCQTFHGDPGPRTLNGSAEALLLETARVADEARGHRRSESLDEIHASAALPQGIVAGATPLPAPQGPAGASVLRPTPLPVPVPDLTFDEWFEKGIEASLQKRQREALEAFRHAARLNPRDPKTQANIVRLEQLLQTKEH
jgi:DNA-binding response OmpR family regulator